MNQYDIRVNIHGDNNVGKTSLYKLYLGDLFNSKYKMNYKSFKYLEHSYDLQFINIDEYSNESHIFFLI